MTRTSSSRRTSSRRTSRPSSADRLPALGADQRRRGDRPHRRAADPPQILPQPRSGRPRRWPEFREAMRQGEDGAHQRRQLRLKHLDDQGVWGEVVFPSLGLWYSEIESPDLVVGGRRGAQRLRARRADPRRRPASSPPPRCRCSRWSCRWREVERALGLGFKADLPADRRSRGPAVLERRRLGAAVGGCCEEAGPVPAFHIGTDGSPACPAVPQPRRRHAQLRRHVVRAARRRSWPWWQAAPSSATPT